MDCHDAKDRLRRERTSTAVRRHLAHCQDCREFSRDLSDGERELSAAFLSVPPSPGFEERVAQRVAEREISVHRRPRTLLAAAAVPFLLLLAVAVVTSLFPPATGKPPAPPPPPAVPEPVVTDPRRENPLELFLWRERSDSDTELLARFAGESVAVTLAGDVETTLLNLWVRGARRVEMRVSPEVPGREIIELIELLEKSGFSWEIRRKK
jgi:hypothetical protein